MFRDKLSSYWPIALLCAAGLALPILATMPWLPADKSSRLAYPVRLQLPPPRQSVASNMTIADFTESDLITVLTDSSIPEERPPSDALATVVAPQVAQGRQVAATVAPPNGLLTINFDLADPSAATDSQDGSAPLEARKGIWLDGVDVGTTAIRITSGSSLFIARDELRNLLSASGRSDLAARLAGGERSAAYVSFDEIRRLGFGVRYDPVSDRILVST